LHHFTNAVPTSKNSWPRPGATEEPVSDIVPTLMALAEMPRPLPPVALPGPQIFFRVPKSPGPAAALALADAEDDPELEFPLGVLDELELDRPHAAKAVNVTAASATAVNRVVRFATPRLTPRPALSL
jgi:hypothetical protein